MLNTSTTRRVVLILTFFIALATTALGQKTIAVSTANNWTFYTDFSTALNECASGSTIYLPGGYFVLSQGVDTIDKQLTIIGVGHYPDSSAATNKTVLQGELKITSNCSNSILIGFELTNGITNLNTSSSSPINNLQIIRCKVNSGPNYFEDCANLRIQESIFMSSISFSGQVSFSNGATINNSILSGISNLYGGEIRNTIFTSYAPGGAPIYNSHYVSVYNCIFLYPSSVFTGNVYGSNNLTFMPSFSDPNFTNTITNGTLTNTFVNVPSSSFSYGNDYHVLLSSAAHHFGTDGTDIGIYGTVYSYKPSAVPANPHISTKSISPSSAPNGTLQVNIRVIAQDR